MQVELWICPRGHYYGSSGTAGQDLSEIPNLESSMRHDQTTDPAKPVVVSMRGDCQICQDRPARKLVAIEIDLDDVFPEPVRVAETLG